MLVSIVSFAVTLKRAPYRDKLCQQLQVATMHGILWIAPAHCMHHMLTRTPLGRWR